MPVSVFLHGKHIDLVALTEAHAAGPDWFAWFNDAEVTRFMQKHYHPNTPEQQLDYYRREVVGNPGKLQLGVVPSGEDHLVGVVSLSRIDHLNQKAEIALVMGNPNYRNMRHTLEAMKLTIEHGFDTLNLRRIHGGTLARDWALLLCRTLGFREEGVLRQDVYKDGAFQDIHLVAVLRDDYRALPADQKQF